MGGYINPDKSLLFGLYENPYALKSRVKAFSNSQKTFWIYKNYSKFKIVDSDGTTLVLLDNKKVYEFHEGEWLDDLRGAYKARVADHYDDPSDNFTPLHKFKKQKRKNKE